ncbi:MAG: helix-turn-helix transcriptional regulator [Pseudomonadota bacterium]
MALLNSKGAFEQIAETFEATCLGAPFKVLLHGSVSVEKHPVTQEIVGYTIPDLGQLAIAVLLSRLSHPRKLSGKDVKFIRKVLGIKQKKLAEEIEVSTEHLSRFENGGPPLSAQGDKYLRLFAIRDAFNLQDMPAGRKKDRLEEALDNVFYGMRLEVAHDPSETMQFDFFHLPSSDEPECPKNLGWAEEKTAA